MRILYLPEAYSQQRQHEKPANIYPVLMAMEATYMRNQGHEVVWDDISLWETCNCVITQVEGHSFLKLPRPDRILTRAFNLKYQNNGNFKYKPGTYIQAANGCWWGKCKFCIEQKQKYEVRLYQEVIDEIRECCQLGFREIFDDSGTFPVGDWLDSFLDYMIDFKYKVRLGCNMRLVDVDYELMRQAGFRMLLFGLESTNQETLDRINKGIKVEDYKYIIKAAKAGIEPHVAVMFGYPWETDQDSIRTLKLVWWLLRKGYAKTAQASFYMPKEGNDNESQRKYVKKIYDVVRYPDFWFNKIRDIKNVDDLKYFWFAIKKGLYERLRLGKAKF